LNHHRIFALAKKELKKTIREPAALFMIILFPVLLTLVFGTSFGAIGGTQLATYQIGVVNLDSTGTGQNWSQSFIAALTGTQILKIQTYADNGTAQYDLVQGKIQAVMLIPSNFRDSCDSFWRYPEEPSSWINTTIQLYLDSGSVFATQAIPPMVQQVLATSAFAKKQASFSMPIQISNPSLISVGKFTTFDFMAPGIFAYASIFITMIVAQSFVTDRENGSLRRINTTPTTPAEFMMSQAMSNMIIGLIQVALVFTTAYVIGYRPKGDAASLALAFGIITIFSLCNVGFGLITATLAKSAGAATGIAFLFILPQMFLGTFVVSALSQSAQAVGRFVPSYYVTDAVTSLFLRAAPPSSPTVLFDVAVVSFYSIGVLLVGIELFKRRSSF